MNDGVPGDLFHRITGPRNALPSGQCWRAYPLETSLSLKCESLRCSHRRVAQQADSSPGILASLLHLRRQHRSDVEPQVACAGNPVSRLCKLPSTARALDCVAAAMRSAPVLGRRAAPTTPWHPVYGCALDHMPPLIPSARRSRSPSSARRSRSPSSALDCLCVCPLRHT